MESALRPPLPTATQALADIQIQARLTNGSGQNIIASIRGSRRQVADIKSESRPASNRNRWPASYWNAWPASSESAVGLEKTCGYRPVIFYTNGFDIWIWDDAQGFPPRKLYGFYSKDSLQHLANYQRKEHKPLDTIEINEQIVE